MIPPAIPANEPYRLFTLKRLHLESPSVLPFLTSIVQLAHKVFDVPVAFVSAVESERQCFLAKIGVDIECAAREITICGHVVGSGKPLLLPDTRLDPRFADNPFVTAPENPVLFYAGQPIRLKNDSIIGTLCIIDHQPRNFSPTQFQQLGQMAGLIAEHFELRLKETHCDRVENLLTRANQLLMTIDYHQDSQLVALSEPAHTLLDNLPVISDLKDLAVLLAEHQQQRYIRQIDQLYSNQADQINQSIQVTLNDQTHHWFDLTIFAERDTQGALLRAFLYLDDMTAQKNQQHRLEKINQRYETILEATETGSWEWDMGEHIEWSAECMKILGFVAIKTKLALQEFKRGVHPDDVDMLFEKVDLAIKQNQSFNASFRLKNHLNSYTWIQGRGRVITYNTNGKPVKMVGTHTNIDNLIKLQEDLKFKQQQAELSTQAKSQFIANVSHELRTPLNAILGLSHLLESTDLNKQQQDYLSKIDQASKGLLLIINELLDFTKVDAGKVALEYTNFALYEPFDYVVNILEHKCKNKKIALMVNIADLKDIWVVGDGLRLQQVLSNLLSNAIKFTDYGEVRLDAKINKIPQSNQYQLAVTVSDTGIGMSEAQITSLFEPFYQADASTTRRYGGTGLGLTISQAFIQQMGGEISVKSQPGEGSEFRFSITLGAGKSMAIASEASHLVDFDFTTHCVWAVEDNLMNQQIMHELFQEQSLAHELFESGEQLLAFIKHQATDLPSAILIDQNLTGMTGLATLAKLRKMVDYQQIPVIILSAADLSVEVEARSDPHLMSMLKPFTPQQLFNEIARLIDAPIRMDTAIAVEPSKPIPTAELPMLEGFNFNDALIYLGGSQELLMRLLADYHQKYHDMGEAITQIILDENWQALKMHLHSFKGISEALGSYAISQRVTKLEKMLLDQQQTHSLTDDAFKHQMTDAFNDCKSVCQHRFSALGEFLSQRQLENMAAQTPIGQTNNEHSITNWDGLQQQLIQLQQNLASFDGNSLFLWQELENELSSLLTPEQLDEIDELINLFEFEQALAALNKIDLLNHTRDKS